MSRKQALLLLDLLFDPSPSRRNRTERLKWIFALQRTPPEHAERELAVWTLAQLQPPGFCRDAISQALRSVLSPTTGHFTHGVIERDAIRWLVRGYLLSLAVCCFFAGSIYSGLRSTEGFFAAPFILFLLAGLALFNTLLFSPLLLLIGRNQSNRHLKRLCAGAATALGRLKDRLGLDGLAQAAVDPSESVSHAAVAAIGNVLPLLTPEDYGRLRPETVPNLCQILSGYRLTEIRGEAGMILLLEALEKVGDGRAVEAVEALAAPTRFDTVRLQWSGPWNRPNDRVRSTALRVLPILKERRRQEQDRSMLLRSSQTALVPEALLRPADDVSNPPSEQLLRPNQPH